MKPENVWWKWLGVLLLLYSLIAGMLIPLKPGIIEIKPSRLEANQTVVVNVSGYNTHYTNEPQDWKAYLRMLPDTQDSSDYFIVSDQIKITNDTKLEAHFKIPTHIPGTKSIALFTFILDHPNNGNSLIPGNVIIHQDSVNDILGKQLWSGLGRPKFHSKKLINFPYRNILYETIRNTFYHVSLWFAMFLMFGMSVYYSVMYLLRSDPHFDIKSDALVRVGILFGVLGCITGSLWAKYTWNAWWTRDIKLNMAALTLLIYFAYLMLRASIEDADRRARISAAYNIFALMASIPLIFILPRLTDSLHPGNGGNPAFGSEDMDNILRMVFYPAVLGFMLLGLWMASLLYRIKRIKFYIEEKEIQ